MTSPKGIFHELSDREYQILGLSARAYTTQDAADELNVSVHTINGTLSRIYSKLGVYGDAPTTQRLKASLLYWGVAHITETGSIAFLRAPVPK